MSFEDPYFDAPPRGIRVLFALAGLVMVLFGLLLAFGGFMPHAHDHALRSRLIGLSGSALALYGIDLVVRAFRPRTPGRTLSGVSGAVRLVGGVLFASLLLGTGVFGVVRGDLLAGGFLIATGLVGLLLVVLARARDR